MFFSKLEVRQHRARSATASAAVHLKKLIVASFAAKGRGKRSVNYRDVKRTTTVRYRLWPLGGKLALRDDDKRKRKTRTENAGGKRGRKTRAENAGGKRGWKTPPPARRRPGASRR